jgi:diaminopimelate epimerase
MIYFTKMHGLGNDFAIIDNIEGDISLSTEEIRKLSDRRFGIGFDQLLMVESASSKDADFRYVIFNADGSEVNQCGNGARCFALYIQKKNLSYKNPLSVETNNGIMVLTVNSDDSVRVEMGEPNFLPSIIPLDVNEESSEYMVEGFKVGSLSIGNPHAILILDDISDIDSGFMKVLSKDEVQLRVVERGAGETLACGSGACAAVIHGIRLGLLNSKVKVRLNGGNAMVEYGGQKVYLTGPGEFVYEGSINLRSAPS